MVKDTPASPKSQTVIPPWLRERLTHDDLAHIAAAVRQVEVATRGEIVPMVVRQSAATGHTLPLLAMIFLALYFAAGVAELLAVWRGAAPYWMIPDLLILGLLAWALSRPAAIMRLLTSDADLELQVLRRAELEFFEAGLNKTIDATGILLFVSLAERRAVVLADRSIAEKLPPETWHEVVTLILAGIKRGELASGMTQAIRRCGELVSPHFPMLSHDRNELGDALIIKE